jgi:hypothetical protein
MISLLETTLGKVERSFIFKIKYRGVQDVYRFLLKCGKYKNFSFVTTTTGTLLLFVFLILGTYMLKTYTIACHGKIYEYKYGTRKITNFFCFENMQRHVKEIYAIAHF